MLNMLIVLVLGLVVLNIENLIVGTILDQYSFVKYNNWYTGELMARKILDQNGLGYVNINKISGKFKYEFDLNNNVLKLSNYIYDKSTITAIAIALHECGHVVQYSDGNYLLKIRKIVLKISQIIIFAIPIILSLFSENFSYYIGVILLVIVLCVLAILQVSTVYAEIEANKIALDTIKADNILTDEQLQMIEKVMKIIIWKVR